VSRVVVAVVVVAWAAAITLGLLAQVGGIR
jgi:hypothetical protein